jgi:hypothetical protein
MPLRFLVVPLVAFACLACAPGPAQRDDAAVLRAALGAACEDMHSLPTILSDATANSAFFSSPSKWPHGSRYWWQLHFRSIDATAWPPGALCPNVRIVTQREIDKTLPADLRVPPDWQKFRAAFPGARGYSAYSRPIYSSDGMHALIFTDHHCEGFCGLGEVLELDRVDGRWRTVRRAMTWIS